MLPELTWSASLVKGPRSLGLRGHLISRTFLWPSRVRFACSGGWCGEVVGAGVGECRLCLWIGVAAFGACTRRWWRRTVWIALPRGVDTPQLEQPPLSVHRFAPAAYAAGVEVHALDGVEVKVYGAENTLAGVFKFRNQVGMDVVLEAMELYSNRSRRDVQALLAYARVCRVERVIRPYVEALL